MGLDVDWSHGAAHMWDRHQVTLEPADEALAADERIVADPDPRAAPASARGWPATRRVRLRS